jgi:hypothetical protein
MAMTSPRRLRVPLWGDVGSVYHVGVGFSIWIAREGFDKIHER